MLNWQERYNYYISELKELHLDKSIYGADYSEGAERSLNLLLGFIESLRMRHASKFQLLAQLLVVEGPDQSSVPALDITGLPEILPGNLVEEIAFDYEVLMTSLGMPGVGEEIS